MSMTLEQLNTILDTEAGGIKIRDMSAITFYQWVLGKISGVKSFDYRIQELTTLCNFAGARRILSDDHKLTIIAKLRALSDLGVTFP